MPDEKTPLSPENGVSEGPVVKKPSVLPFVGQIICGLVLCVYIAFNAANFSLWKYGGYAACVGAIGTVLGIIGFFALRCAEEKSVQELADVQSYKITPLGIFGIFCAIFWVVGASILTFGDPFTSLSNAYIASWGGAVCGCMSAGISGIETGYALGPVVLTIVANIVVLVALAVSWSESGGSAAYYAGQTIFGFIVTIVTIVVCLIVAVLDRCKASLSELIRSIIFTFLAVVWFACFLTITFSGPFSYSRTSTDATINGFFGSWAALFAVGYCASQTADPLVQMTGLSKSKPPEAAELPRDGSVAQ